MLLTYQHQPYRDYTLTDDQWAKLEAAGWSVDRAYTKATKDVASAREGILEWEAALGLMADEVRAALYEDEPEPDQFHWMDGEEQMVAFGRLVVPVLFPIIRPLSYREMAALIERNKNRLDHIP